MDNITKFVTAVRKLKADVEMAFNGEITNEKVSMAMLGFGIFMIALGFRKYEQKR